MARVKPITGCIIVSPMSSGRAEKLARMLMECRLKKMGLAGEITVRPRRANDTEDFLQSVNGVSRSGAKEAI